MNSYSYGVQTIEFPRTSPPSVILQKQQQQQQQSSSSSSLSDDLHKSTTSQAQEASSSSIENTTGDNNDADNDSTTNSVYGSIYDSSSSSSSFGNDDDDDLDDSDTVKTYHRMWTQNAPFIRISWRRDFLEQDVALAQFWSPDAMRIFTAANATSGIGCCTLPTIQWSVDNPQQCQYEVEVLAKAARDMDLYQAGVAPFVPLRYLALIAAECPQAFARSSVRDVAALLNAVGTVPGVAPLVAAVLTLLDEVVVDELALFLADATRAPAARCAAAKVVEGVYQRALARRIPVVGLAAAAAAAIKGGLRHFRANPVGVNDVLAACLVRIGAPKSLALIRRVYEARRVTPAVLGDYGFVVRSFMRAKAARARVYSAGAQQPGSTNAGGAGGGERDSAALPRDSLIATCDVCRGPLFACTHGVDAAAVRAVAEGVQLYERRRYGEALPLLSAAVVPAQPPRLPLLTARLCRVRCLMHLMRYEEAASDFAEIPRLPDVEDFALCEKILQAELLRACPATLRCAFALVDAAARERPASPEPLLALAHLAAARTGREREAAQNAERRDHYHKRCKCYGIDTDPAAAINDAVDSSDGPSPPSSTGGSECAQRAVCVDWLHPVAYPVVFCQPGRTPSLAVGKNCFAFLNGSGRIEVAQFIDFFGYYEEHARRRPSLQPDTALADMGQFPRTDFRLTGGLDSKTSLGDELASEPGYGPTVLASSAPSSSSASPSNPSPSSNGNESGSDKGAGAGVEGSSEGDAKKALPLLRSVINSTLEHCERIAVDPTGSALVTAKADESHTVVVLGISQRSEVTREVVLGRTARVAEHVACGGYLGGIAAVAAGGPGGIAVWHWREPEGALRRGPHRLAGTGGRVLALAMDSTANVLEKSGRGLSLFAVVREAKRVCVLEYGLERHDFRRTLLGLSPALGPSDPTPDPADLPAPTAAACARPYLAVATADARLFVWDRRTGALAGRARCASVGRALAFIPGVALLCGLQNGSTVVYALDALEESGNESVGGGMCSGLGSNPVPDMTPVAEICGPELPVCAIAPVVQNSQLLLRIGYADSVVSSLLFNTFRERKGRSEDDEGDGEELRCGGCGKVGRGFGKCGRCLKVAYCSKECQEKDWGNHKLKCTE